jgi:hypothetical protein
MNDAQWEKFIADRLGEAGKKIIPPQELLSKIFSEAEKPAVLNLTSQIRKDSGWKWYLDIIFGKSLYISMGIVMILLAIFVSLPGNPKVSGKSASVNLAAIPVPSEESALNVADQDIDNNQPLTTDDVDAAAVAILASESDEDAALSSDVDNESSDEDSAAINNLEQNYDQDQF